VKIAAAGADQVEAASRVSWWTCSLVCEPCSVSIPSHAHDQLADYRPEPGEALAKFPRPQLGASYVPLPPGPLVCNNGVVLKPRPNHSRYLQALRQMSPSARLAKAFELSAQSRQLFFTGLRARFPNLSEAELHHLALRRLAKCHNRNY
jgi:hypothetical protein